MLLAAVGPDEYGYAADPHPFENINLVHDGTAVTFAQHIDLGKNTFNFYGHVYTGAGFMQVEETGYIRVGFDVRAGSNWINKTLSRTVLTSVTVFLVVVILFVGSLNGLTAVQGFSVALLFGLITGTYSSIFVAAPLLIADKQKTYRFLGGIVAFLVATGILNKLMRG